MTTATLLKAAQAEKAENEARAELRHYQEVSSPEAKLKLRVRIAETAKVRAEISLKRGEKQKLEAQARQLDNQFQKLKYRGKDLLEQSKRVLKQSNIARGQLGPVVGRSVLLGQEIEGLEKKLRTLENQGSDEL